MFWVKSGPKLLSFKQNVCGMTKVDTGEGISISGCCWQSGLCVEINESWTKLLELDVKDEQVLALPSYIMLGSWYSD